jgi:TorA maturation chaperone TorD
MPDSSPGAGVTALRDFFFAVDAADIRSAAFDISSHFKLPLDMATDWVEVEYDFNRLFVGPAAVPAPPYASAYLAEPTLMGAPALEVRRAYGRLGLAVPDQGATPDDHLAFELDAVLALDAVAGQGAEANEPGLNALRSWFVVEHMGGWVPEFISATRRQRDVSAPVAMAVSALEAWLYKAVAASEPVDRQSEISSS